MAQKPKSKPDEDEVVFSSTVARRENGDAYEIFVTRKPGTKEWNITQGEDDDKQYLYLPDDKAAKSLHDAIGKLLGAK